MSNIIKSSRVIEHNALVNKNEHQENINLKEELLEEIKEQWKKIILKAEKEAAGIIDSAHKKHKEILNLAYERSKDILDESKSEGYSKGFQIGKDEGYKEGYEIGKKESEKLIEEALDIKSSYIEKRNEMLKKLEEDIVQLVISIYQKILYKKVEEDKELIISLVLSGIDNLEISEKLTIIVSKEDYDTVNKSKNIILAKASLIDKLDIRVNSDMEKGDCILETSKGSVDVSVKNQIKEVKDLLISILNNE